MWVIPASCAAFLKEPIFESSDNRAIQPGRVRFTRQVTVRVETQGLLFDTLAAACQWCAGGNERVEALLE